ncbi:hypothetical protein H257_11154 [Aphanomyces astaci]|uniref:Polymerase nucleotidyl transferase domain-containing protein n=1 Tax=Aphanomyces astaci TaxID=112090 RepID=W4G4I4_APHAT|nr:hypothetical protein H257_11154 [Aphanomyces astaci]ETV74191.1 hypothetical protein H257_11154 [Aphanomyces astaci]|eukprot:XP_009836297.1 hypothetical protein H257_11154 [Aphanomyces astaci]
MRLLNPSILGCPALRQVDAMINQAFGPTLESERVRAKLLRYLRHILDQGQCSYLITPSGSYPLKTHLPDSDIDVCLEVPDAAATWHLAVTQALIGAATPVDSDFRDFTASDWTNWTVHLAQQTRLPISPCFFWLMAFKLAKYSITRQRIQS